MVFNLKRHTWNQASKPTFQAKIYIYFLRSTIFVMSVYINIYNKMKHAKIGLQNVVHATQVVSILKEKDYEHADKSKIVLNNFQIMESNENLKQLLMHSDGDDRKRTTWTNLRSVLNRPLNTKKDNKTNITKYIFKYDVFINEKFKIETCRYSRVPSKLLSSLQIIVEHNVTKIFHATTINGCFLEVRTLLLVPVAKKP